MCIDFEKQNSPLIGTLPSCPKKLTFGILPCFETKALNRGGVSTLKVETEMAKWAEVSKNR